LPDRERLTDIVEGYRTNFCLRIDRRYQETVRQRDEQTERLRAQVHLDANDAQTDEQGRVTHWPQRTGMRSEFDQQLQQTIDSVRVNRPASRLEMDQLLQYVERINRYVQNLQSEYVTVTTFMEETALQVKALDEKVEKLCQHILPAPPVEHKPATRRLVLDERRNTEDDRRPDDGPDGEGDTGTSRAAETMDMAGGVSAGAGEEEPPRLGRQIEELLRRGADQHAAAADGGG
jgi:hypothetical protein